MTKLSIRSMLLILLLIAGIISLIPVRLRIQRIERLNSELMKETGHFIVLDPEKLYTRELSKTFPLSFPFRLFVPDGKQYVFHVEEGIPDDSGQTPELIRRAILGRGKQEKIILRIQRFQSGNTSWWSVDNSDYVLKMESRVFEEGDRFNWLLSEYAHSTLLRDHGATQIHDPFETATLCDMSENDRLAVHVGVADPKNTPRRFKIWLEPLPESQ